MPKHCSTGYGGTDGLDADAYARYLVGVLEAFHARGINFSTIDPFNEPNSHFWPSAGHQEGANFDSGAPEQKVVTALCSALRSATQPLETGISFNDGNKPRETKDGLDQLSDPLCVTQINTHTYEDQGQADLRKKVEDHNSSTKDPSATWKLSMSEFGSSLPMTIAVQIADDLQELRPSTWVYWQAIDNAWGLLGALPEMDDRGNLHNPPGLLYPPSGKDAVQPNGRYSTLAQFTRYIRPGALIYPLHLKENSYSGQATGGDPRIRVVVAKNMDQSIAIVATNPTETSQTLRLSLHDLHPICVASTTQIEVPLKKNNKGDDISYDARRSSGTAPQLSGGELSDALSARTVTTYVFRSSTSPSSSCASGGERAASSGKTPPSPGASEGQPLGGDLGHLPETGIASFTASADRICGRANQVFDGLPSGLSSWRDQADVSTELAALRQEVTDLAALVPPQMVAARYHEMVGQYVRNMELVQRGLHDLQDGNHADYDKTYGQTLNLSVGMPELAGYCSAHPLLSGYGPGLAP